VQLRSPQLQQALGSLTSALQSDNFETVFANFNLQPADGAEAINVGDGVFCAFRGWFDYYFQVCVCACVLAAVRAFLLAIQAQVDREAASRK
jgi:hypothetical protein